jgi:hypothetical protein
MKIARNAYVERYESQESISDLRKSFFVLLRYVLFHFTLVTIIITITQGKLR